jgi:hypothetical protein
LASRARILETVSAALSQLPQDAIKGAGVYLFWRCEADVRDGAIVYVGIVKQQSGHKRAFDYVGKQISILDRNLLEKYSEEAARDEVRRRLMALGTLGTTAIERSYIREHLKSRELSRADRWTFFPADADGAILEAAESLLVAAAVRLGCPALVNKKKVKAMPTLAVEGARLLAEKAIAYWRDAGLRATVADAWLASLKSIKTVTLPPG